jgi:hypothetical protein
MEQPFRKDQKEYVKHRLSQFGYYFEEWENDIENLTMSNYQIFNKKLLNTIYDATVNFSNHRDFKKMKTLVNFERCKTHPHEIQDHLLKLYLNIDGNNLSWGSACVIGYENFMMTFNLYMRMFNKVDEMIEYDDNGSKSEFVEKILNKENKQIILPVQSEKKSKRYIVNGILY